MKKLPRKVVIVGAGPSGLFAARALQKTAEETGQSIEITLIEREAEAGGKCSTYSDLTIPQLKTERGAALVAGNYGAVLEAMKEYGLDFESTMPAEHNTVEFNQLMDSLSLYGKLSVGIALLGEIITFYRDYGVYQQAKEERKPLPPLFEKSFLHYAKARNMDYLPLLAKPFVPGFGYGDLACCPAYSVLEYFGKTTLLLLIFSESLFCQQPLLSIKGGFQSLMKAIAATMDVRLNAKVTGIQRHDELTTVNFVQEGKACSIDADLLILANSPKNWPQLNMELTEVEKACVEQLEYYRYPVAVCKIKGLPAKHHFFPEALSESGFGHVSLITTRDNRPNPEEGRLCTVYVNLKSGKNDYKMDHAQIIHELKAIKEVTDVEFLEEKIWEDYMSTLPWDLRLQLDAEQEKNKTLYLGSYALGGFEDVASVANKATDLIHERYTENYTIQEKQTYKNVQHAYRFFRTAPYDPVDSEQAQKLSEHCWCQVA